MMLGRSWEGKQKVRDRWSIPLRIVSQVLGSFWINVGLTLVSLWTHLGIILESFLNMFFYCFGIIWGLFWDRFGIVLVSFWDHVGIFFG